MRCAIYLLLSQSHKVTTILFNRSRTYCFVTLKKHADISGIVRKICSVFVDTCHSVWISLLLSLSVVYLRLCDCTWELSFAQANIINLRTKAWQTFILLFFNLSCRSKTVALLCLLAKISHLYIIWYFHCHPFSFPCLNRVSWCDILSCCYSWMFS